MTNNGSGLYALVKVIYCETKMLNKSTLEYVISDVWMNKLVWNYYSDCTT